MVDTRTQLAADHPALLVAAPAEEVVLVVSILNTANSQCCSFLADKTAVKSA